MTQKRERIRLAPEDRKLQILNVAEALFIERGFEAVEIAHIAEEAQVSRGTVYHYFPSTEVILERLLEASIEEIWNAVRPIIERPTFSASLSEYEEIFDVYLQHAKALKLLHSGGGPIFQRYRQHFLINRLNEQVEAQIPADRPPYAVLIINLILEYLAFMVVVNPTIDASAFRQTLAILLVGSHYSDQ